MTASLAYRKNEQDILSGNPPQKYLRILPYIPGSRVLEIGSAEGVLSLLMAKGRSLVVGLEKSLERHESALELQKHWAVFPSPVFINGDIQGNLELLARVETLVAVRTIYYLGDDLDRVFKKVGETVSNVVLCGNRNRADRWRAGTPDEPLGEMNKYASLEGMKELLIRHGYKITTEVTEGDEIVVGHKD